MITETSRNFEFGAIVPRRLNAGGLGDWFDDIVPFGTDFNVDFSWDPIDLATPIGDTPGMLVENLPADSVGPTTSSMIDPSFDWSGTFKGIVQAAGALVPVVTGIVKSATGEGQKSQQPTPAGYYRNAQGQLVPIQPTGGGMSWVMIAALAAGAYFLAKK